MEILQRPHPSFESMSEMVLVKPDGKEVHLLTVCDFSREQAKRMRKEIEDHQFAYVAKYCNGGLPTDLDQLLAIIKAESVPRKNFHFQKAKGKWDFWGDIPSRNAGFFFHILSEEVAYRVMAGIQVPTDSQLQHFMSCHAFKATPSVKENLVLFHSNERMTPVLPGVFESDGDRSWRIPSLGVWLRLRDTGLELVKNLIPERKGQSNIQTA